MRDPEGLGRITRCDQEEKKTCLCEFLVLFKDVLDLSDKFVEPEFLVGTTPSTKGCQFHPSTNSPARERRDGTDLEGRDDVFWTHGLFRVLFADLVGFGRDGQEEF